MANRLTRKTVAPPFRGRELTTDVAADVAMFQPRRQARARRAAKRPGGGDASTMKTGARWRHFPTRRLRRYLPLAGRDKTARGAGDSISENFIPADHGPARSNPEGDQKPQSRPARTTSKAVLTRT